MPTTQEQKAARAERILEILNEDLITFDEVKELLDTLVKFVQEARNDIELQNEEHKGKVGKALDFGLKEIARAEKRLEAADELTKSQVRDELDKLRTRLEKGIKAVSDAIPEIPEIPKMPNLEPLWDEIDEMRDALGRKITPEQARDLIESLEGDERVDVSAIKGIEELIKKAVDEGRPLRFGAAGGGRGFYVYVDGIKKGIIKELNFAAGTGMAIAYSVVNGRPTLTFDSSGGSGVVVETPVEAPNAVRTVFTVSAQPKWVVADGTTYFEGQGYSYAALAITMDIPPSATIRVIT